MANPSTPKRKKNDSGYRCIITCTVCERELLVSPHYILPEECSGFEMCFICKETCCRKCVYEYETPENCISWDCIRILLIARYKEGSSPFRKEKLPMEIFKSILFQAKQTECKDCAEMKDMVRKYVYKYPACEKV